MQNIAFAEELFKWRETLSKEIFSFNRGSTLIDTEIIEQKEK